MSRAEQMTFSGDVTDVFAHRFVVKTAAGPVLVDLGPAGAERVKLRKGDRVDLWGEMKPSELKVARIAKAGADPIAITHGKPGQGKPDHDGREADPAAAIRTVEAYGYTVVGVPRRKPRHVEILGRGKGGEIVEFHVALDGTLRKSKPLRANEPEGGHETKTADRT